MKISKRKQNNIPLLIIVVSALALYSIGITWGLPGTESWLSDSLAPFHPLLGLARGFSFGYLNKYPLVHQFLLAVLNLPVVITALINSDPSNGMSIFKLVSTLSRTEYATALILIDRIVSVFMGTALIVFIYKITRELFDDVSAFFAALIVLCNGVLCLYSHLSKVEVPYLFWGVAAVYYLLLSVKYDRKQDHIKTAVFACLSFGSKDQGYALFVLPFLWYLVVQPVIRNKETSSVFKILFRKNFMVFSAYFLAGTLVTQNIILNWSGFIYRLKILTGWNSERSKSFTNNLSGQLALFHDSLFSLADPDIMSLPLFLLSVIGIILVLVMKKEKERISERLLPLLSAVSYYLFFVMIIKQTNRRFLLPQSVFLAVYGGYAVQYFITNVSRRIRYALYPVIVLTFIYSMYFSISVPANLIHDLRYRSEKWMNSNMPDGSIIEYYSYLHYLPRFPVSSNKYRVTERPFDIGKRNPDFIVLTSHYYTRFTREREFGEKDGRILTSKKGQMFAESDFAAYLPELLNGNLNYHIVKEFHETDSWYKKIRYSKISPDYIIILKRNQEE